MKTPMLLRVNKVLMTGLFLFSSVSWCTVGESQTHEAPLAITLGEKDKSATLTADGGGDILRDAGQANDNEVTSTTDEQGAAAPAEADGEAVSKEDDGLAAQLMKTPEETPTDAVAKNADKTSDKTTQTDDFGGGTLNINTATADEMVDALKGIGPKKAQAIIDYREAKGPFKSVEQLTEVKGIGPSTLAKFKELVVLE